MNTRKIVMSSVIAVAVLAAMLVAVPSALAAYDANSTYFEPEASSGAYCQNNTIVQVRVNTSVSSLGGGLDIYFDPSCVNITAADSSGSPWTAMHAFNSYGNYVRISSFNWPGGSTFSGDNLFTNITLHCINSSCNCASSLNFSAVGISDAGSQPITMITHNGTITCTGAQPINVDIHAEGINGDVINATNYAVSPGTVTEDGITMNNWTAMGAMVAYCQDNGINVWITVGSWGNYTVQIGNDAANNNSWMYAVDGISPWVSGDKYGLSGGEYVHWYNYLLTHNLTVTSAGCCPINVTYGWGLTDTVPAGQTRVYGTGYYYDAALEALVSGDCIFKKWVYDGIVDTVNKSITVPMDGDKTATGYCGGVDVEVEAPVDCVNGDFTVNITANPNGLEVYGVQYELTYNASVIRLNMQNEGDFLNKGTNTTTVYDNTIDNINGQAAFGVSRKNTPNGTTAQGTVAVLSFTTVGNPYDTSDINLSAVVVSDEHADQIDATLTNDNVTLCDPNQSPVANASSDYKYNNVGTVFYCKAVLNGSLSNDPDGSITQWLWAFGDGNFDSGEIREHTYASYQWTGSDYTPFIANLTVTDNGGASANDGCEVQVYIAGEANGDGKVNVLDAAMIGLRWNKECADYSGVCWGVEDMADRADLNNDCWVNIQDAVTVGANWGNTA